MIMRELAQAKLAVIARCGHWSPIDAPEEVGCLAVEFLRANPLEENVSREARW
jgi:pimeloyl-ACP methyl ester carboxylesterase